MKIKQDIKDFTLGDLKKKLKLIKVEPYRAAQIFSWIYKKNIASFTEMKNLSKEIIEKLGDRFFIGKLKVKKHLKSKDKTEKFLFELEDGNLLETVLIPAKDRTTVCISTQAGCKFACAFCASGIKGFIRDLTVSEILGQIMILQNDFKQNITNYVFMGMGEPLDNFDNLIDAIKIMNSKDAMNIGARRITVSTCGYVPGIEKLAKVDLQINLSVSLHAANNKLRDKLVPINKTYPIENLIDALEDYMDKGGRKITFEYVLIKGVNDSWNDAKELANITRILNAKVNVIPYSEVKFFSYAPIKEEEVLKFMEKLEKNGVNATVRKSKGKDISAACGQLKAEYEA